MTFNHKTLARQFETIMEKIGSSVRSQTAGTGTIYVTVNDSFKVRFADHGECYCHEDISVDPDGCTLYQAIRAAGRELNIDVSSALAGMDRARKVAVTRQVKTEARVNEKIALRDEAAAKWIAANVTGFDSMRQAEQSRVRMQAFKETAGEWQ